MAKIPVTVERRLKKQVPKFQKILASALSRDVNEADTVIIITDILEQVFGLDKYNDITREYSISGTYVDLAVVIEKNVDYLIEVKAVGNPLKESYLRQVTNYAAKEGVKWAILTNGVEWEIHRITVDGQVANQNILKFNFLELNVRSRDHLDSLFLLCKKGVAKNLIEEYYEHKQIFNRHTVGMILVCDDVLNSTRKILKKLNPKMKITNDQIREKIVGHIVKREIFESDLGKEAEKQFKKFITKEKKKSNLRLKKSQSEQPPRLGNDVLEGGHNGSG